MMPGKVLSELLEIIKKKIVGQRAHSLQDAILRDRVDEVASALAAGADPNLPLSIDGSETTYTPIEILYFEKRLKNRFAIMRLLADHGACLDTPIAQNGFTPLGMACLENNQSFALELVRCGADLYRADRQGRTPGEIVAQMDPTMSFYKELRSTYEKHALENAIRCHNPIDQIRDESALGI